MMETTERKVRVRFAPSPTGALHIGGVRTALYNYLFAKQHGGDMILRIEDTDSQRFVPGAEAYIIEALEWLGIKFDEGVGYGGNFAPYRQSERKAIYRQYVDQLLADGKAYIAFDTPAELDAKRQEVPNFQYDASTRTGMRNSLTMSADEVDSLIASGHPYVVRIKIEPGEEGCRRRPHSRQGNHQLVDTRRQGTLQVGRQPCPPTTWPISSTTTSWR